MHDGHIHHRKYGFAQADMERSHSLLFYLQVGPAQSKRCMNLIKAASFYLLVYSNYFNDSILDEESLPTRIPLKSHKIVAVDGEDESKSDSIEPYAVTRSNFSMCLQMIN